MKKITLQTFKACEWVDITSQVQSCIESEKILQGLCLIYSPHTTAGITINENADPDVKTDSNTFLNHLIPKLTSFRHNEGNSDAHIKTSLVGNSVQVIIENGELQLGTWQSIYFCEFDGPRTREVWIKAICDYVFT